MTTTATHNTHHTATERVLFMFFELSIKTWKPQRLLDGLLNTYPGPFSESEARGDEVGIGLSGGLDDRNADRTVCAFAMRRGGVMRRQPGEMGKNCPKGVLGSQLSASMRGGEHPPKGYQSEP